MPKAAAAEVAEATPEDSEKASNDDVDVGELHTNSNPLGRKRKMNNTRVRIDTRGDSHRAQVEDDDYIAGLEEVVPGIRRRDSIRGRIRHYYGESDRLLFPFRWLRGRKMKKTAAGAAELTFAVFVGIAVDDASSSRR